MMNCSVVIPAHNCESYISQTIDALLPQVKELNSAVDNDSKSQSEIIVINDCSSDTTAQIVSERYANNKEIRLINRNENAGEAFIPRLEATRLSKCENVCFIDADDIVDKDYIAEMLKRKEKTGADIVLPIMRIFGNDISDSSLYVPSPDFDISKIYSGKELIKETLVKWRISGNGGLYTKSYFLDTASKFTPVDSMIYNDEVFIRYLLVNSHITAFQDSVYYYRVNPESVTKKPSIRQFHILVKNRELRKFIIDFFGESSVEWEKISIQSFHELIESMRAYNRLPSDCDFRKEAFNYLHDEFNLINKLELTGKVSRGLLTIAFFNTQTALRILKQYDALRNVKRILTR